MLAQAIITLIYGIIIAAGGVMGYVAAKSTPSLISGGILGVISIIAAVLLFMGRSAGRPLAIVAAALVAAFFAFQLIKGISSGGAVGRAAGILAISIIEILVMLLIRPIAPKP